MANVPNTFAKALIDELQKVRILVAGLSDVVAKRVSEELKKQGLTEQAEDISTNLTVRNDIAKIVEEMLKTPSVQKAFGDLLDADVTKVVLDIFDKRFDDLDEKISVTLDNFAKAGKYPKKTATSDEMKMLLTEIRMIVLNSEKYILSHIPAAIATGVPPSVKQKEEEREQSRLEKAWSILLGKKKIDEKKKAEYDIEMMIQKITSNVRSEFKLTMSAATGGLNKVISTFIKAASPFFIEAPAVYSFTKSMLGKIWWMLGIIWRPLSWAVFRVLVPTVLALGTIWLPLGAVAAGILGILFVWLYFKFKPAITKFFAELDWPKVKSWLLEAYTWIKGEARTIYNWIDQFIKDWKRDGLWVTVKERLLPGIADYLKGTWDQLKFLVTDAIKTLFEDTKKYLNDTILNVDFWYKIYKQVMNRLQSTTPYAYVSRRPSASAEEEYKRRTFVENMTGPPFPEFNPSDELAKLAENDKLYKKWKEELITEISPLLASRGVKEPKKLFDLETYQNLLSHYLRYKSHGDAENTIRYKRFIVNSIIQTPPPEKLMTVSPEKIVVPTEVPRVVPEVMPEVRQETPQDLDQMQKTLDDLNGKFDKLTGEMEKKPVTFYPSQLETSRDQVVLAMHLDAAGVA